MKKRGTTSGAEIRARRIKEVTLPSGIVVEVRQPSMLALASGENTPDLLRTYVAQAVEAGTKGKAAPPLDISSIKAENFGEFIKLLDSLARACLVYPRVVDKPIDEMTDDEISLDDLTDEDKSELMTFAFGGEGNAAARFPEATGADVGTPQPGEGIQSAP